MKGFQLLALMVFESIIGVDLVNSFGKTKNKGYL